MPAITADMHVGRVEERGLECCPFHDLRTDICTASCSAMRIDARLRGKYCGNEDFDDCPIFLVKKIVRRR